MRYTNVDIAGTAHALPERVVTSEELEERLAPLYERLSLRPGRIELMTGIRERRHWEPGTRPSAVAARAGRLALERSGITPDRIGCLIHASVSRDFMEPATASIVHRLLELPDACAAFDLSNACLGFANAMCVVADRIERGEIEAGLVVAGEDGRPLVDATVRALTADESVGKRELKLAFASLTIGSGAAAMVLARSGSPGSLESTESTESTGSDGEPRRARLVGGAGLADTSQHELCHGDRAGEGDGLLMQTDSEALLVAGNALAARTWEAFEAETGWSRADVDRIVTHQVGVAHRRLTLSTIGLDPALDYPTVETLGNIGSVSLPLSFDRARASGFVEPGHRVALLGIGSGLQCLMLAVEA